MIRTLAFAMASVLLLSEAGVRGQPAAARQPIIDMHMHAMPADFYGKAPAKMCAPQTFPWVDPRDTTADFMTCVGPQIEAGATDDEVVRRTVAVMTEYNITGVISAPLRGGVSPLDRLKPWQAAAPDRVIPGVWSNGSVPLEQLRTWGKEGRIRVLGELTFQYPIAAPSLRGSEPPLKVPSCDEMVMPWAWPAISSHGAQRWTVWPRCSSARIVSAGKRFSMCRVSRASPSAKRPDRNRGSSIAS